jgi:hypothetical protein
MWVLFELKGWGVEWTSVTANHQPLIINKTNNGLTGYNVGDKVYLMFIEDKIWDIKTPIFKDGKKNKLKLTGSSVGFLVGFLVYYMLNEVQMWDLSFNLVFTERKRSREKTHWVLCRASGRALAWASSGALAWASSGALAWACSRWISLFSCFVK